MQTATLHQYLSGAMPSLLARTIRQIVTPAYDRLSSSLLNTSGLVISGAGGTTIKSGATAALYIANGVLGSVAAATVMPVLTGITVANATFNVICFFVNQTGTVTAVPGTAGASLGVVKFPQFPSKSALLGFVVINPTGTGAFVGGTTALDDATVVPNAVYISTPLGIDPYCLIG
jgi:hypothetical protein